MVSNLNTQVTGNHKKMEKLALIKERHKKLILEPRKKNRVWDRTGYKRRRKF